MESLEDNNQGYALIVVLWAIVILSIIFVSLTDEVHLSNLLVRNNLEQKKLQQGLTSAMIVGINQLQQDETDYDNQEDKWFKPSERELGGINYKIQIEDVGSKLNINYTEYDILTKLSWWNEELIKGLQKRIIEQGLIPDLVLIKDMVGDNYPKILQTITTTGRFNLNTDRLENLKKILELIEVDNFQQNLILNYLRKLRKKDNIITKVDDLQTLYLKGLNTTTLKKLKPYITTEGRLNINFVSERIINLVFEATVIKPRYKERILAYRQQGVIQDFTKLEAMIPKKELNRIKSYFTISSTYFLIKVKALSSKAEVGRLKVIVERRRDNNDQWRVRVIKWGKR